ncbi:MAG: hypothetical protein FJ009_20585 [Chloroflexi bacterium]|nr:hypothetical protein [Chloroflexota bacterium]
MKKAMWLVSLTFFLIGCWSTPTPVPPTQTPWVVTATPAAAAPIVASPDFGPDTVSWNDAKNFVGQTKTVCGNVMRTTFAESTNGQPTYLDLGRTYPDPSRFSVVIWGNQRANFPTPPETLYRGKTICVNGAVRTYQGVPQIEVRSPAQVQVK